MGQKGKRKCRVRVATSRYWVEFEMLKSVQLSLIRLTVFGEPHSLPNMLWLESRFDFDKDTRRDL